VKNPAKTPRHHKIERTNCAPSLLIRLPHSLVRRETDNHQHPGPDAFPTDRPHGSDLSAFEPSLAVVAQGRSE